MSGVYKMHLMIDIDELVHKCRDRNTKELIAEAVINYKSGAFRSAVVSAWIAVALDFNQKLRELAVNDDANARTKLSEFTTHTEKNDVRQLLKYEQQLLTWARDGFQFIAAQEFEDLERLRNDRSRCAHPSMLDAVEMVASTYFNSGKRFGC